MEDKRVLANVNSKLQKILGSGIAIPKGVQTVFRVLERNLHLLHCLPTSCRSNVCSSGHFCPIPQLNKGIVRNARAKLTLYTGKKWKIRIDLRVSGVILHLEHANIDGKYNLSLIYITHHVHADVQADLHHSGGDKR